MRDIRFRAIDEASKEWIYGYYVVLDSGIELVDCIWKLGAKLATPIHYSTLGQYTGLTDKNGVEIYEGDILKCFNGSQDKVGTVVHVCYDDTYTGYYPFNRDEVGFNTNSNSIEVIGNIYEHKHLLEEYKNENKWVYWKVRWA